MSQPDDAATWIAGQIIELGRQREEEIRSGERRHADDEAADRFLHEDSFALLLGILSQQWHSRAGAAGEVPWRLRIALGHLDPHRIAGDGEPLREKFTSEICRRPGRMAEITVPAARHVIEEYDGKAERVWLGVTDPSDVRRRFRQFYGLGRRSRRWR
jgi:hypothetical protein